MSFFPGIIWHSLILMLMQNVPYLCDFIGHALYSTLSLQIKVTY